MKRARTSVDHRTRVGRERRARTESRIVEAALHVFAERGPDAPVIDEFVRAAGVSRGTFYNHFESVEELLHATSAWTTRQVVQSVERDLAGLGAQFTNKLDLAPFRHLKVEGEFLPTGVTHEVVGAGLLLSMVTSTLKQRWRNFEFPLLMTWLYFGCLAMLPLAQTFYTIPVLPVLAIIIYFWQWYSRRAFIKVRQAISVVNDNLQESISGVRVTQGLSREKENLRQFDKVNKVHLDANKQAASSAAAPMPTAVWIRIRLEVAACQSSASAKMCRSM